MKNQNSISKPTVITKPLASVSTGTLASTKNEKLSVGEKKMDLETNQQQQSDEQSQINNNQTSSTPLTDKVTIL